MAFRIRTDTQKEEARAEPNNKRRSWHRCDQPGLGDFTQRSLLLGGKRITHHREVEHAEVVDRSLIFTSSKKRLSAHRAPQKRQKPAVRRTTGF